MCVNEATTDFHNLLIESLTQNGTLAKMRAELRAQVYLTLEDETLLKPNIKSSFCQKDYLALLFLVHDFLNHQAFEYTLSVFEAEAEYLKCSSFQDSSDFFRTFPGDNNIDADTGPVLLQVFQTFKDAVHKKNLNTANDATYELKTHIEQCHNENTLHIKENNLIDISSSQSPFLICDGLKDKMTNESAEHFVNYSSNNLQKSELCKGGKLCDIECKDNIKEKSPCQDNLKTQNKLAVEITTNVDKTILLNETNDFEKYTEIASSSPINVMDNSVNLMKFDDSLNDISAVKSQEPNNHGSLANITTISEKYIISEENLLQDKQLYNLTNTAAHVCSTSKSSKKLKDDSSPFKNTPSFCDTAIKNICKPKIDTINSTSLPSFYINISNMDGLDLDSDSLDNYEEDILSMCTHNAEKVPVSVAAANLNSGQDTKNSTDRGLFTVANIGIFNPEKNWIGDGPNIKNEREEESTNM